MQGVQMDLLRSSAGDATRFLKALANQNRLLILCHLIDGEKSVGELERAIGLRQPTLSQQLARLRSSELVRTRRDAKSIYYSIAEDTGMIGASWGVNFCVVGLDRNMAYSPGCRMARARSIGGRPSTTRVAFSSTSIGV